jgi:putative chitinase
MELTADMLRRISKGKPKAENVASIVSALRDHGQRFGLDQPHRLAHFLSQLAHESGGFFYDREIASGAAYEGLKDLGNTKPGDGKRFKGRGPIQITGRANYRAFTKWARKFDASAPDFEANPDAVNTDPWEGLGPIWYWDDGNPTGKTLNTYADKNNLEMITRKINGGVNGIADRMDYYDRAALALLGYPTNAIPSFQVDAKRRGDYQGELDGKTGPQTRAALHISLVRMTDKAFREDVAVAPVVEEKPVPVPVNELEKPWYKSPEVLIPTVTPILPGLAGFDRYVMIVAILVGAGFAGYLIWRRNNMKAKQEARVEAIKERGLS